MNATLGSEGLVETGVDRSRENVRRNVVFGGQEHRLQVPGHGVCYLIFESDHRLTLGDVQVVEGGVVVGYCER